MKWNETTACRCRYGDDAACLFENAEVIWEHSMDDYQGYANVFARLPDGRFCHYEWTYGSCSGCDEWESRVLTHEQIEAEMRRAAAYFDTPEQVRKYLKLEDEYAQARVPTANSPTNGSIPGMMRAFGGWGEDFNAMRDVVGKWLEQECPVKQKSVRKKKTKKKSKSKK